MDFTINVHVTGLDRLAEGLLALTGVASRIPKGTPANTAPAPVAATNPSQAPAVNTSAAVGAANAASAGTSVPPAPSAAASGSMAASVPAPANVTPFPATAPAAPASAPAYTADDLAQPAVAWMDADRENRMPQLLALNAEFGIQSLGQLPPERYGEYALRLRQLGVNI